MRLDKILANSGFGSRKEVKQLLKKEHVTVDGKVVKDPAMHVNPMSQEIFVLGEKLDYKEFIYLMLNKQNISRNCGKEHESSSHKI